jgi:hypothetical protein
MLKPTTLRQSIAQALKGLCHLMSLSLSNNLNRCIIREYVFLLYDCMNDDDEDIRAIGATAACRALGRWNPKLKVQSLTPLVASTMLAVLIASVPEISNISRKIAIQRMTTSVLNADGICPPLHKRFELSMKDDTTLFAVEKPNIYIDEIRESNIWALVLRKQVPKDKYAESLEEWAHEGLQLLLQTIEVHPDGALGWSSKPDMFLLVLQILNASDVALTWQSAMMACGQSNSSRVLEALTRLTQAGRERGLHEMILDRAAKILDRAIVSRLKQIAGNLAIFVAPK